MDMGIKGKTAIVCASSRGLGKGCAAALASEGVDLIINGRNEEVLYATGKEIRDNFGVKVTEFCADITSKDQQTKLLELCPSPDILVNNAGGPPPGDFREWSREDWTNACIANMFTPIELIKAYVDGMQERKFGRIINITSIVGITGNAGQANYAASKSGLIGLTKSIAKEVASRGITANCVAPGWIETSMTDQLSTEVKNKFLSQIPAGKIGQSKDIANAVIFLASDEAEYITGQTITVDGGRIIN